MRLQSSAYKTLRPAALAIERHVLKAVDAAIKQGRVSIAIPVALRDRYRKTLYRVLLTIFDSHRQSVRKWIQQRKRKAGRVQETVDHVVEKIIGHAYRKQTRFYDRWFRQMAWEIEKKRFKDTVERAKVVVKISREKGLTRVESRELLATKFQSYSQYELDRVITTEDTRMLNIATRVECDEDETIIGYEWRVNYTGCDVCDALDGKFFPKDEVPDCPAHPNCQCTTEPVFAWERKRKVA